MSYKFIVTCFQFRRQENVTQKVINYILINKFMMTTNIEVPFSFLMCFILHCIKNTEHEIHILNYSKMSAYMTVDLRTKLQNLLWLLIRDMLFAFHLVSVKCHSLSLWVQIFYLLHMSRVLLAYFIQQTLLKVNLCDHITLNTLLRLNKNSLYVFATLYQLLHQWRFQLLPQIGYCYEHGSATVSVRFWFRISGSEKINSINFK